ncbi:MAG: hypothetical protein SVK08_02905 [Halobacteriota archaeon]|nr:hypothetical protein [Halobacteriota archaeon]
MTDVERMLSNEMLACEGMIYVNMFLLLLMAKKGPDEFLELTKSSEDGLVEYTVHLPTRLVDYIEEVRKEAVLHYVDVKFDNLNEEQKKVAIKALGELSKNWVQSTFGQDLVIGLGRTLSELSKEGYDSIMERMTKYNSSAKSLQKTLKEFMG